jgi:hypothetical protein
MKPVHLVLTVFFAIVVFGGLAWLGSTQIKPATKDKTDPVPVLSAPEKSPEYKELEAPLPLPEKGPYGKAVVVDTAYDFGTMEMGEKNSHVFEIKNEGEGPLRVKHGLTSCGQCTFGKVTPENEDIPPGGTATVEVNWEIKFPNTRFRQTADVHTTDPNNRKLQFAIMGQVDQPLHMVPSEDWPAGELSPTETSSVSGILYTTLLDKLEIEKYESSSDLVTVTWVDMTENDLVDKKGKLGKKIKVSIAPGSVLGPMRESIKLHLTTNRGSSVIDFTVSGKRLGPIQITGAGYLPGPNLVKIGEFEAAKGAKKNFQMHVREFDGDLEAAQVDPEKSRAKVTVVPSGKVLGKTKIYNLTVEVPAGNAEARLDKNAEPVVLKLNHPSVTEFKLYIDYRAN